MVRFLFSRLVQSLAVLWIVYTLTFVLLMLAPGDPFITGDKRPTEAARKALAFIAPYHNHTELLRSGHTHRGGNFARTELARTNAWT